MRHVSLPYGILFRYVEAKRAAFRTVEQGREYRGRIEVREAEPLDIASFGDERSGSAITDDAIIEAILYHLSSCWVINS